MEGQARSGWAPLVRLRPIIVPFLLYALHDVITVRPAEENGWNIFYNRICITARWSGGRGVEWEPFGSAGRGSKVCGFCSANCCLFLADNYTRRVSVKYVLVVFFLNRLCCANTWNWNLIKWKFALLCSHEEHCFFFILNMVMDYFRGSNKLCQHNSRTGGPYCIICNCIMYGIIS